MTDEAIIEVVTARKNGKPVQKAWNNPTVSPCWETVSNDEYWNFSGYIYRTTPEPLVIWAYVKDGKIVSGTFAESIDAVRAYSDDETQEWTLKKFVESE